MAEIRLPISLTHMKLKPNFCKSTHLEVLADAYLAVQHLVSMGIDGWSFNWTGWAVKRPRSKSSHLYVTLANGWTFNVSSNSENVHKEIGAALKYTSDWPRLRPAQVRVLVSLLTKIFGVKPSPPGTGWPSVPDAFGPSYSRAKSPQSRGVEICCLNELAKEWSSKNRSTPEGGAVAALLNQSAAPSPSAAEAPSPSAAEAPSPPAVATGSSSASGDDALTSPKRRYYDG